MREVNKTDYQHLFLKLLKLDSYAHKSKDTGAGANSFHSVGLGKNSVLNNRREYSDVEDARLFCSLLGLHE